jgi:O-antigen ligase
MKLTLHSALPTLCLIAALAMAPVAPEAGNVIFLVAGAIGLLAMWPGAKGELVRPIIWMPLAGLVLVAIAYLASAGPSGLEGLLIFAPMMAIWPLVTLLRKTETAPYAMLLGLLALGGVGGAAVLALSDFQATGAQRAGADVANPIHFADTALLVGFAGLVGAVGVRGWSRALFALSPLVAIVPVVLSGTRGAIVAFGVMALTLALAASLVRLFPRRLILVGSVLLIAGAALALALGGNQLWGIQRMLGDIVATLATGAPTDNSTSLRFDMYLGAWRAFLEAPFFGHGPFAFVDVANSLAGEGFSMMEHLHNDLADMAASAGLFGLVAYALFILAPIVEALRAPASDHKPMSIVLAVTLVTGFFVMGLTNAMFGILTLTTTFAAICVIVGMLASPETKPVGIDQPAP